ncbi:HNH endonuclease [Rossellomorea marisflavi]|uniref:HNH endonuclease n=1 Tax=Rossellomorea marisflavi TaxID=189381 RepID=UPI003FA02CDF
MYIRKETYDIEAVLSKCFYGDGSSGHDEFVDYDGDNISMKSLRYKVFKEQGTECVSCGLKGRHFAKERSINARRYHFNLYGLNAKGNEVMFTKDRIIPKAKGEADEASNFQTLCMDCREKRIRSNH